VANSGRLVAKLVGHLLAMAALWVGFKSRHLSKIQNGRYTVGKEWPTHSSQPKIYNNIKKKGDEVTKSYDILCTKASPITLSYLFKFANQ
jgi:hypothetical protein